MLALQFAGGRHFLEFFSHKYRIARFPEGNVLLKAVGGQKPREIAAEVLNRINADAPSLRPLHARGRDFVENFLDAALANSQMSPADRRLCQELAYGVVRWKATLDWLIARRVQKAPNPRLQNLLRLGLYQIFWLERIPNHAAVHETVELAKQAGFHAQAGFVNAMLRGYLREFKAARDLLADLKTNQPHIGFSHPEWLVARWQARWGDQKAAQLMEWNNSPPKTFARINLLKADPGKLLAQWREEGVDYDFVRRDWIEENLLFEIKSNRSLRELPSFQQGLFYVQDPSTLLAVRLLDPRPGESVLDLCAAPGGKLSFIAQLIGNEGRLVAHDTAPERLKLIEENCARLGVSCAEIVSAIPRSAIHDGRFHRVLVDAPCSNTGTMRRRVDLRWRIRPEEIERLRGLQLELLRQAAELLLPEGALVYSTCSLEPEENSGVVRQFLRERNEFKVEVERELVPFVNEVDGAYVALLKSSH